MVCQICSSKAVSSKFLIKDYEYNIEAKAEYKVCNVCTVTYRQKINKSEIKKSLW